MSSSGWCTIESDPGVFTELIERVGVRDVQVDEVYSFDEEFFAKDMKNVYGFIFLFKWQPYTSAHMTRTVEAPNVFFAQQVVNNACATQAILSVLFNRPEVDLGEEMSRFKSFAKDLPPDMRGLSIGQHELIRTVHNSFGRPEPFVVEERRATDKDDVYHFISYVPVDGVLYELDGLKNGPVSHGEVERDGDSWVMRAREVISERMSQYSSKEIRFSLLAVTVNRKKQLVAERERLEEELEEKRAEQLSLGEEAGAALSDAIAAIQTRIASIADQIATEEDKFKRWRSENIRRKHNYVPFVVQLLRILAEKGKLQPMLERARERVATERDESDSTPSSS